MIRVFPNCYSNKHYVYSSPDNQHLVENLKEKRFRNFRQFAMSTLNLEWVNKWQEHRSLARFWVDLGHILVEKKYMLPNIYFAWVGGVYNSNTTSFLKDENTGKIKAYPSIRCKLAALWHAAIFCCSGPSPGVHLSKSLQADTNFPKVVFISSVPLPLGNPTEMFWCVFWRPQQFCQQHKGCTYQP